MKLSALNQAEILSMSPSELMASLKETPDEEVISLPPGVQKYVELALRPESRERALYEQPTSEQRLRSLLSGATLGLSEPVIAAGKAAAGKVMGEGDLGDLYSKEIAAQEQYRKEQPGEALIAEIAGGLSPIGLGAKTIGLGAKAAKSLTKGLSEGVLKKALQPILSGALGGAATGAVSGGAELLEGKEPSETAQDVVTGTGAGAVLSAIPVVGKAAVQGAKAIGQAAPTILTGVPYKSVGKYLKRAEQIEELAPNRMDFIEQTTQAVSDLKDRVVNQSKIARRVLNVSDKELNLSRTNRLIGALKDRLSLSTGEAVGPGAQASIDKITNIENTLNSFDGRIGAKDAKKVIDELDDTISYIEKSGDFTDAVSNNLSKVRRSLDLELKKQVPAYAAKMKPLAEDTRLLNEALKKKLNNPETAANILPQLDKPKSAIKQDLLKRISEKTGSDLLQTADDYQTLEAFEKTYPQGSARTVLFGVLGSMLGISPVQNAGIGVLIGAAADKFGPQAARSVLKAVTMAKPTIEGLGAAIDKIPDLPQAAKDAFKATLIQQRIERE